MKSYRLFIAIAGAFLSAASFWMSLPLIAVSLRAAGIGVAWIGLISALPWLGFFIISPAIPKIVTHLGLQRTVLTGILTSIVVFTGFALSRSVAMWSLLFFLQGGTLALRWAAMDSWIAGAVPDHARARLIGLYELAASGSMAAGPACLAVLGDNGARPFSTCAALAALAAILLLFAGREPPIPLVARAHMPVRRILLAERVAFIGIFLVGFIEASDLALLPVFGLGFGAGSHLGALLVVCVEAGVAGGAVLFSLAADRFNRRTILLVSGGVTVLAPLALPAAVGNFSLWPDLVCWGLAQGGLFTLGMVLLGARFRGPSLAPAIALAMAVYTAGGIAGPAVMGVAMGRWGDDGLPYGLALVAFLALAAASCFEVFGPRVVLPYQDRTGRPA